MIKLFTGKKHQIRLQFYLNKNPIIGDKKFSGEKFNKLLLCSYKIIFRLYGKFYKFKINPNKIPNTNMDIAVKLISLNFIFL